MLRALAPFFELIVYTRLSRAQGEPIFSHIEEGGQIFFSFLIPQDYTFPLPIKDAFCKDLSIFLGNRTLSDIIMVSSSGFESIHQPLNAVPVAPFRGETGDCLLLFLEIYLM